ncbi:MAG: DUF3310 domain-containing protein [Ilumatobacteraceae bacterium]
MTTARKKKPAPPCSRCPGTGMTWREFHGKRTWFCEHHLKEAEREVREAKWQSYQESRVEDLASPEPEKVQVPQRREVTTYRPRDPALMCGHPTSKSASGSCRNYYPCGAHGQWRLHEPAAPAHPTSNTAVDHPPHYNVGKYEVIDVIEDWRLGFNLGNVIKYVARAEHKGRELEDLDKAAWYLAREIARRKS